MAVGFGRRLGLVAEISCSLKHRFHRSFCCTKVAAAVFDKNAICDFTVVVVEPIPAAAAAAAAAAVPMLCQ